jgi:hypothetical protein
LGIFFTERGGCFFLECMLAEESVATPGLIFRGGDEGGVFNMATF